MIAAETVRSLLEYDPNSGAFTWRGGRRSGKIAGFHHHRGYWAIGIGGVSYYAHRLAWLYVTGEWPSGHIDHRDGNTSNNRFGNLRLATHSQNMANAKLRSDNNHGFKGVLHVRGKWFARTRKHGRLYQSKALASPEEAHAAYLEMARQHHGEFARAPVAAVLAAAVDEGA